jgi:hypothetical protein
MKTLIELLDDIGMLRPTLNIGHGNFISDPPNLNYAVHADLDRMGRAGVSVSHCPINIVRRGRTLDRRLRRLLSIQARAIRNPSRPRSSLRTRSSRPAALATQRPLGLRQSTIFVMFTVMPQRPSLCQIVQRQQQVDPDPLCPDVSGLFWASDQLGAWIG